MMFWKKNWHVELCKTEMDRRVGRLARGRPLCRGLAGKIEGTTYFFQQVNKYGIISVISFY
jgi:hypothetical protein